MLAGGPVAAGWLIDDASFEHLDEPHVQFALTSNDGGVLRSDDQYGKVDVIAWWASWCAPCRAELPDGLAEVDRWGGHQDPRRRRNQHRAPTTVRRSSASKQPPEVGLAGGRGGAVTFEQTFGSALNANLHFHALVLDGVYDHDEAVFHSVPAPTTAEVQTVVDRVRARVFQTGSIRSCDGGGC